MISLLRSVLRQEGLRLPSGSAARVLQRLDQLTVAADVTTVLAPLREVRQQLTTTLTTTDEVVETRATHDAGAQRLMTAPGIGPVLALTFQAVLDDPARFGGDAARASAFIGLVPSEDSSAERQHKGHITKTGPRDLRTLLVQASGGHLAWPERSRRGPAHVGPDLGGAPRTPDCGRRAGAPPDAHPVCDVAGSDPGWS